jgi:hypothetical protein
MQRFPEKPTLGLLFLLALPFIVQAQFTYVINSGVVTITSYTGTAGAAVVPNTTNGYPVTAIGAYAFAYNDTVSSIALPSTVTNLGDGAFLDCEHLDAITVDSANPAYSSADGVLFDKQQATLVAYPSGKSGGYVIPSTVTTIGNHSFGYLAASAMTSVAIPGSVLSVGAGAFEWSIYVTNLTVASGVVDIGVGAFSGCERVATFAIPATVTNLGDTAFSEDSMTAITVDPGNAAYRSVGGALLNKAGTRLIQYPTGNPQTVYTVPNGVLTIGDYAFENASLADLTIADTVTNIESVAFYSSFIRQVVIPDSVLSIGDDAFVYSTIMTNVTIGTGVTYLGAGAFYDCSELAGVLFEGDPPGTNAAVFEGDSVLPAVYYAQSATGWGTMFDGVPAIEVGAIDTVTLGVSPAVGGTVSGAGTYLPGSSHTVTATANASFIFTNWTQNGLVVSTATNYTLTVNGDVHLVANFIGSAGGILYRTLDAPGATYGTWIQGISSNNVVGYYEDSNTVYHGFLFDGSAYTMLDAPAAAGVYVLSDMDNTGGTFPMGISGDSVVGYYTATNGVTHGFLYRGGTFTTLDDPEAGGPYSEFYYYVTGGTWAYGIENGNIVGDYTDSSGNVHGFLYEDSNYTTMDDPDATYAANGGWGTHLLGISGGNIVGYLDIVGVPYGTTEGMLYNGIGYNSFYGNTANGIAGGNIVGASGNSGYLAAGDFVSLDGTPYFTGSYVTLNVPGAGTTGANGIAGNTFVGSYTDSSELSHGFIANIVTYTVAVSASPAADGTVSGAGTFIAGSSQTATASANTGYTFVNWTENGQVVSTNASYNFTLSDNLSLVANFSGSGSSSAYRVLDDPAELTSTTGGSLALGLSGTNIVGTFRSDYDSGFLYNGSAYETLQIPDPNYPFTVVSGISGNHIVGWYSDGASTYGFIYTNGAYTTLRVPSAWNSVAGNPYEGGNGGYGLLLMDDEFDGYSGTFASGVSGDNVVGWYIDTNGYTHGFRYNGQTYTTLDDPNGVGATFAQGIDGDNIVGFYSDSKGATHGFLYNGSGYSTLDVPAGIGATYAQGISGSNVVGWYFNNGNHGFVYNGHSYTTFDVPNALGGGNTFPMGIYSNTIVGWYIDSAGENHGFATSIPYNGDYTITVSGWPALGGSVSGGGSFAAGSSQTVKATSNSGFMFTNWTVNGSIVSFAASYSFTLAGNLVLQANFVDLDKPALAITNVPAGLSVNGAAFAVSGTARDNWQVDNVFYSLNNSGWSNALTANGWTNWTAAVTLVPGTNTFAVYAVDPAGDVSPITNASLFFLVTNQLQMRSMGLGTISPNYSNAWLALGRNYSITSAPASGFVFSNWTVATNWAEGTIATGKNLHFMMSSNLTLLATFVETSRPSLTITAPASGRHLTNALAGVTGTTSDKWAVAGVRYQLNAGGWSPAATTNGWTNWSAAVELLAGTNTIKAYAVNLGGNLSTTGSVSFVSSNTFKLQLAFTNAQPLQANGLVFNLLLSTGLNGQIEVSSNLATWSPLASFTGTNATLTFQDPAATNSSRRYYRAIIP